MRNSPNFTPQLVMVCVRDMTQTVSLTYAVGDTASGVFVLLFRSNIPRIFSTRYF